MHHTTFIQLSNIIKKFLHNEPTPYNEFIQESIHQAEIHNPWFIEKFVKTMLLHIQEITSPESLMQYVDKIQITSSPQKVLVIAAGNIPMVSFRDVMDVLLSGHYLVFKPSSKDTVLMKMLLHILMDLNTDIKSKILIRENTINKSDINAVIATGTNNTAMHFQYYFSDKPKIIRNNRTSIAILDNTETDDDLKKLADDILLYFGLGCRNVSKIFIQKNFDIQRIFKAIYDYGFVMQHHKYMNNYDYYRSIYLLNKEYFLENNFLIVKENKQLHAPVANLFYEYYSDYSEINHYISQHQNDIQTIVGKGFTPYGNAQFPALTNFADGINTIEFLKEL